jgi:hypothetical protein
MDALCAVPTLHIIGDYAIIETDIKLSLLRVRLAAVPLVSPIEK